MRLDYPAITEAIRGSMRQWWRRAAWWWISVLILALGYRYLYSFHLEITANIQGGTVPSAAELATLAGGVIKMVAWPGAMVVWLLAIQQVNRSLEALFPTAEQADDPRLHQFRFIAGMRQGIIPVAAFTVFSFLHSIIYNLSLAGGNSYVASDLVDKAWLHFYLIPLFDPLVLVVAMTWVTALAAVTSRRPWIAGAWIGLLFGLPVLAKTVSALIYGGSKMTVPYNSSSATMFGGFPGVMFMVGLAAGIAMILGFRYRQALSYWVACGILAVSALYESAVVFWGPYDRSTAELRQQLFALVKINSPFQFLPAWLTGDRETGLVQLQIKMITLFNVPTAESLQYVNLAMFLAINVAWLLLLYWFMRLVLLEPTHLPGRDQA